LRTRRSHLVRIGLLVTIASASFLPTSLRAQDDPPLGFTLRTIENPAGVRVVIEFSRRPVYEIRTGRNKIIMKIREGPVLAPFKKKRHGGDILRRIRFSGGDRGGDLIFYTEDQFGTFSSFEMGEPFRVVLDLRRRKGPPMAIGVPSPRRPGAVPGPEEPESDFPDAEGLEYEEPSREAPRIPTASAGVPSEEAFVVVIDPGHGGEDMGARGPSGLVEKFVTLDIARRLRERIQSSMDAEVILTRETDRVITLDERTALANHNRADLFVCIHANASRRPRARGAETYFLSYQATDDEARAVAAIENNTLGLDDGVPRGDGLEMILWDIAQSAFLRESSILAEVIQDNLNDALGITNRGIKQAPFRVLMGATMPAVLIEVAFISNPDEERRLRDPAFKDRIADAIFESIDRYHDKFLRPRDR
jgi:N-acetylmuramoyl-L-alanine amidase